MDKEELKQKAQAMLDELNEGIDKLESKAQEIGEDIKEGYSEQLEKLKELKSNVSQKMKDLDDITDDKWDIVKDSAGNFFTSVGTSLKENYSKVAGAFKKSSNDSEAHVDKDINKEDYSI